MQSFSSHVSIQTEGTQNVLVIELQEGQTLIPYCCKVMESNNIPGLLPMRHQTMDGVVRLRYNIGGKVPLREYLQHHQPSRQNSILLLRNLSSALLHLNEYFLSTDMCYLDPEHIYVGDGLHSCFACVPVRQEGVPGSSRSLKSFYEKLLSDYFANGNDPTFVEMFMWVYRTSLFDLETFYRQFLQESTPAPAAQPKPEPAAPAPARKAPAPPAAPAQPAPPAPPAARPEQGEVGLLQKAAKAAKSAVGSIPSAPPAQDLGFAIPNAPGKPAAAPPKPTAAPPAGRDKPAGTDGRKGFLPFGKHGKKENTVSFAVPGQEAENAAVPSAPKAAPAPTPPVPRQKKQAQEPQVKEEWFSDSILVDGKNDMREQGKATAQAPAQPTGAWFLHNGQKVAITETPFLVGKYNTTCQLHYSIYDNNKVSRSHATFLFEKGHYLIRDNQSRNGTFLNGQALLPLQPVELKDGDEIKLYDEVLIFHTV